MSQGMMAQLKRRGRKTGVKGRREQYGIEWWQDKPTCDLDPEIKEMKRLGRRKTHLTNHPTACDFVPDER